MRKIHRAWIVAAGCCLIQSGILGIVINCRGIFFTPICTDLGISLSSLTLYGIFYGIACCLTVPFVASAFEKINLRALFSILSVVMAALIFSCGFFSEVWLWYIAASLQGICAAFLYSITTATLINNWFNEKKGLALGLAGAAPGLTGALMNPVGSLVINNIGWRAGYFFLGIVFLVLVFPAAQMVKLKPSLSEGESPLGESNAVESCSAGRLLSETKSMPSFYLVIIFSGIGSGLTCYTQMLTSYGMSLGYSSATASLLVTLAMLGNVSIKFVVGLVLDAKGLRKALAVGSSALFIGYLSLMFSQTPFFIYMGAFLAGAPMSLVMVILPVLARTLFGNREYAKIYGYIAMFGNLCSSLCLSLFGSVIEKSGYLVSQILCAILALSLLILGLISIQLKSILWRSSLEHS